MQYYITYQVTLRRVRYGDVEDLAYSWVDSREITHLAGATPDELELTRTAREILTDCEHRLTAHTYTHLCSLTFYQPELPF